jgi:hypothetical protein
MSYANPDLEKKISNARWHKRIVLLFDNNQNSAERQLKKWQDIDLDNWDILTIKVSPDHTSLRQKYQVEQFKTLIILIGKDGTEKWRSDSLVDFRELDMLIEKMPMRINEKASE